MYIKINMILISKDSLSPLVPRTAKNGMRRETRDNNRVTRKSQELRPQTQDLSSPPSPSPSPHARVKQSLMGATGGALAGMGALRHSLPP
jgi:hypothetical protein